MVKLIVTDMDNTLILPDKALPKGIFPLISRLYEKGIRFAAASARHYNVLHQMFGAAASIMGFIRQNLLVNSTRLENAREIRRLIKDTKSLIEIRKICE